MNEISVKDQSNQIRADGHVAGTWGSGTVLLWEPPGGTWLQAALWRTLGQHHHVKRAESQCPWEQNGKRAGVEKRFDLKEKQGRRKRTDF